MTDPSARSLPAPGSFDVLIIDGRSGSGKTVLAERAIARAQLAEQDPQLLHVEDLYPGWDGLDAGSRALAGVLARRGYRRYDWIAGEFGEQIAIGPELPLIIEGCGALTAETLAAARTFAGPATRVTTLWLECPAAERRARALARDGDTYAPHWRRWAAQEETLYARTRPWLLADRIIASGR
ncbi:hypothetical protein JOF28_002592 [Leucobacter exalbidus]|uniref:Uncharacterized protein n=1 Tax=Leucobacter exalbidus TaxID=662960 RepID=A0A940T202_9MICO|nr:hypothetical protein [Leucobacter exalbidus]MBP1327360.1 hypothetical protein [Leucobacter exalbidus]